MPEYLNLISKYLTESVALGSPRCSEPRLINSFFINIRVTINRHISALWSVSLKLLIRADKLRSEIELKVPILRNELHVRKLKHAEKLLWNWDPEFLSSRFKLGDMVGVEPFDELIHKSQIRNEC